MTDLPTAPEGALVYTHPQGKTIYVLPDGSMVCYKPDGKRGTSSATPDKLAAGHGGWELREGIPAGVEVTVVRTAVSTEPLAYGLAPQLALEANIDLLSVFVTDDDTVMEQKVDGERVLLDTTGGSLAVRTRDGRLYSKNLPTAVRKFAAEGGLPLNVVIDGELVGSTYWAFDLPVSGEEMVGQPLHVRRAALEGLRDAEALGPIKVIPQARTIDEKHALARTAIKEGFEGVMAKRADSKYVPGGRTGSWLKLKFVKTVDVVVIPKKKDDGHNSVALGVYRDGQKVDIGRASLNGKEKRGKIEEGDVLEVAYLYCNDPAAPRLYQPRILRRRTDKRPDECAIEQLLFTNKTVLSSL